MSKFYTLTLLLENADDQKLYASMLRTVLDYKKYPANTLNEALRRILRGEHLTTEATIEIIKLLLDRGAHPNSYHMLENLTYGDNIPHFNIFKLLIQYGTKITFQSIVNSCPENNYQSEKRKIFNLFVECRGNLDTRDGWGLSIIHRLIQHDKTVIPLLKKGVRIYPFDISHAEFNLLNNYKMNNKRNYKYLVIYYYHQRMKNLQTIYDNFIKIY